MTDCSIIIPAYNAAATIEKTMRLLDKPTEYVFEILIVNDGSRDDTANIVRAYQARHQTFSLIEQKNGGVSKARNTGLRAAKGRYLFFCDADDEPHIAVIEKMIAAADKTSVPLVIGNYIVRDPDGAEHVVEAEVPVERLLDRDYIEKELLVRFFTQGTQGLANLWNKLYNKKAVQDAQICFDEGRTHGEDWAFNIDCFDRFSAAYALPDVVYTYVLNGTQGYGKYSRKLGAGILDGFCRMRAMNAKYKFFSQDSDAYYENLKGFLFRTISYLRLQACPPREKREFLRNTTVRGALKEILSLRGKAVSFIEISRRNKVGIRFFLLGNYAIGLLFFR